MSSLKLFKCVNFNFHNINPYSSRETINYDNKIGANSMTSHS